MKSAPPKMSKRMPSTAAVCPKRAHGSRLSETYSSAFAFLARRLAFSFSPGLETVGGCVHSDEIVSSSWQHRHRRMEGCQSRTKGQAWALLATAHTEIEFVAPTPPKMSSC